MDTKFRKLIELGAGGFEHLDNSVLNHLESIRCLLKEWNADLSLQEAGLYYIAYLENESDVGNLDSDLRRDVIKVIGNEIESIVYHYNIWDKAKSFKQQRATGDFVFYNKLSGAEEPVSFRFLCQLCELFVAIELDKVTKGAGSDFINNCTSDELLSLQPFLSIPARRKIQQVSSH